MRAMPNGESSNIDIINEINCGLSSDLLLANTLPKEYN